MTCISVFHIAAPADAADVVGEAPAYQIGDEWHFSAGVYPGTVRVVAVQGEQTVTEFAGNTRCDGCRAYRDTNLTVLKVLDARGEPWAEADLNARYLDLPLQVGKEWKQDINLHSGDGGVYSYRNRLVVEAYEQVKVKAGTFWAFRIKQYQQATMSNWTGSRLSWWAPAVRGWVRFECWRASPGSRTSFCRDTELELYRLASAAQ
jgi:hypothetical protein